MRNLKGQLLVILHIKENRTIAPHGRWRWEDNASFELRVDVLKPVMFDFETAYSFVSKENTRRNLICCLLNDINDNPVLITFK
jgi:hypothetical protein